MVLGCPSGSHSGSAGLVLVTCGVPAAGSPFWETGSHVSSTTYHQETLSSSLLSKPPCSHLQNKGDGLGASWLRSVPLWLRSKCGQVGPLQLHTFIPQGSCLMRLLPVPIHSTMNCGGDQEDARDPLMI